LPVTAKKQLCVLLAPDSFKGSLAARDVCNALETGILQADPATKVIKIPLADGGEGTVDALVLNTGGHYVSCEASDPLGARIQARYGILGDGKTAVIEMAAASGLPLLPPKYRNPAVTTSYGTGELIRDALERGYRRIILGLGGSATNDYGAGALQALGFSFRDAADREISAGGLALAQAEYIVSDKRLAQLDNLELILVNDVNNPLLGTHGATRTYARQKGAVPAELPGLEAALKHFNRLVEAHTGQRVSKLPGAGAAGGLGAGLQAFLKVSQVAGAELILELSGFNRVLRTRKIDLIITGEGRLDGQTARGKLPLQVVRRARAHQLPVIAVVGSLGTGHADVLEQGFTAVYQLCSAHVSQTEAMQHPARYLTRIAEKIRQTFQTNQQP